MNPNPKEVALSVEEVKDWPSPQGAHNDRLEQSRARIVQGSTYRDCSTVCLMPTRGKAKDEDHPELEELLHHKVSDGFRNLILPMNQKFMHIRLAGLEVADAYNAGVSQVLAHPELSKWKFILTYESDNIPPPDGLVKLIECMYAGPWAAVGGLYWTKGENGVPMIFGDPKDPEVNWRPQPPRMPTKEEEEEERKGINSPRPQECRGLAMGFTLWDMEIFRDKRLGPPWFKTSHEYTPYIGVSTGTQDLHFSGNAGQLGYRFCIETRVRVGHCQTTATPTHPAGFVW